MAVGIPLIISAVPIFMTTNLVSDNRKQRVILEHILKLQQQHLIYLSDVKNAVNLKNYEADFDEDEG